LNYGAEESNPRFPCPRESLLLRLKRAVDLPQINSPSHDIDTDSGMDAGYQFQHRRPFDEGFLMPQLYLPPKTGISTFREGLLHRLATLILISYTAVLSITSSKKAHSADSSSVPNIILILADDMGYGDSSVYDGWITTPHMERMAREGLKFTDFHSSGVVCSPTRAGLMTGRYQQRSGLARVVHTNPRSPSHHHGLQPEEITFAELLKEAGYQSAIFGKWHLGYAPKYNPTRHGFDRFRGFLSGNIDYISRFDNRGTYDWWEGTQIVQETGYLTDMLTAHAVKYINDHKHAPFCLYVSHGAVHTPIQAADSPALRGPDKGGKDRRPGKQVFQLMMKALDESVGAILDTVTQAGIADRTLVVFLSDNGGEQEINNVPWRGTKNTYWEGGHRVPAMAWWPGRIQPGTVTGELCMSFDLVPTILELAGRPDPAEQRFDGLSLVPVFDNGSVGPRQLFWDGVAMRDGPWKLISNGTASDRGARLFNLNTDPAEEHNIAAKHTERVTRMAEVLETWKADVASGATKQPSATDASLQSH